MKLALLVVLAACSSEKSAKLRGAPPPPTSGAGMEALRNENDERRTPPLWAGTMLAPSALLVTAVVEDWTATNATLRLWMRNQDGWQALTPPWPAVIGSGGTAWGAGLHGAGAPDGRDGPQKVEGDGKSPAGAFALAGAYGYAKQSPGGRLPYQPTTEAWKCVDDPSSSEYNRILDERTVKKDWTSAEEMRRKDVLYTYVVDVAHNAARTPKAGSCIFLHVWGGPDSTTVGCTAMSEEHLARLISSLDPRAYPAFALLPRAEYEALAGTWGLPPI